VRRFNGGSCAGIRNVTNDFVFSIERFFVISQAGNQIDTLMTKIQAKHQQGEIDERIVL
jgi:hypothetical protein